MWFRNRRTRKIIKMAAYSEHFSKIGFVSDSHLVLQSKSKYATEKV